MTDYITFTDRLGENNLSVGANPADDYLRFDGRNSALNWSDVYVLHNLIYAWLESHAPAEPDEEETS